MRVTTKALIRNYTANLGAAMSNLDSARTKVMSNRKFSKGYEDPTGAVREASIYQKYQKNQDYQNMIDDVQYFQNAQEDAINQLNTQAKYLSKQYGLEALNGTNMNYETRLTYATAFRQAQESMTMSLNASYSDKFVFGGADGGTPPFELRKETVDGVTTTTLLYRGVDVDSYADPSDPNYDPTDPASVAAEKLARMSAEEVFVDLGFGLTLGQDAAGRTTVSNSSAFNTSLPGINVVGYGKDENGISQNMIVLAGQIADVLGREDFGDEDYAEYKQLLEAFDNGRNRLVDNLTTIGTKSNFLETTKTRLEDQEIALTQEMSNVVDVDMAEAITEFSWAQYAYSAALKIGTSILTPSFIDFMS